MLTLVGYKHLANRIHLHRCCACEGVTRKEGSVASSITIVYVESEGKGLCILLQKPSLSSMEQPCYVYQFTYFLSALLNISLQFPRISIVKVA